MKAQEAGHLFEIHLRNPPGKRPWPCHFHTSQWEVLCVLEGSREMRLEGQSVPIAAGYAMMCSPREAHQLHNSGASDLVVQIIADNPSADYCHYPDSGKWAADCKVFRMMMADCLDGEE
jgi:uncharacterized cupin superfamily protein